MAQQDRINGLVGTLGMKAPVRLATTANITLSGEQTIDGVAAVAGDRVLVKDQTTGSENGIYAVATTAWVREPDFDGSRDALTGTMVHVALGAVGSGTTWSVTTTGAITIGTTALTFARDFGNTESYLINANNFAGTDSTGATSSDVGILAAITYLTVTGGAVFLSRGRYKLDASVAVAVPNLEIIGEEGTIIEVVGANVHNAFTFTEVNNITVRGIRFEWNGAALYQDGVDSPKNYALRFKANASTYAPCYNILVEDCEFSNILNSIFERLDAGHEAAAVDPTKRYNHVVIRNNNHDSTLTCDVAYIDGNLIDLYRVTGNTFIGDADSAANIRMVGGSVAGGNQYSTNGIISGNTISTFRWAIYVGTATNVLVTGNNMNMNASSMEGVDFENCADCFAIGNKIYNTGKPFAIFYDYSNIVISDNQVELNADAPYFMQYGVGTTNSGNLTITGNKVTRVSNATAYAKIQAGGYGGHLNISNNSFDNVIIEGSGFYETQTIKGNYFEYRLAGSTKILSANLYNFAPAALTVTDNIFLGVNTGTFITGVVISSIVDKANTTVIVERNQFTRVAVPLVHINKTAAATTRHIFRDNILDTIDYAFGPTGGGAADSGNLYVEGNTSADGLDYFGSPAGFTADVGTYGCAVGSRIRNSSPASGPTAEWVNISTTGTPNWKPVEIIQCAFLAYPSATLSNVTGAGTNYTVAWNTEVFDDGNNFATNTFTAPVTGRYRLSSSVYALNIAAATGVQMSLTTSNRTYVLDREVNAAITYTERTYGNSVLADMDAGDTAIVKLLVAGMGGDTVDVYGAASPVSYFSGELVQ